MDGEDKASKQNHSSPSSQKSSRQDSNEPPPAAIEITFSKESESDFDHAEDSNSQLEKHKTSLFDDNLWSETSNDESEVASNTSTRLSVGNLDGGHSFHNLAINYMKQQQGNMYLFDDDLLQLSDNENSFLHWSDDFNNYPTTIWQESSTEVSPRHSNSTEYSYRDNQQWMHQKTRDFRDIKKKKSSVKNYPAVDITLETTPTRRKSDNSDLQRSSSSSSKSLNNNGPLTWNRVFVIIALAIYKLLQLSSNVDKESVMTCITSIVELVRLVLFASDTMDKDSIYMKANPILCAHHRTMMAALSKLVLYKEQALEPPQDSKKIQTDACELLIAIRNFFNVCKHIPVPLHCPDPVILVKDWGTRSSVKYNLQSDVADSFEAYGMSLRESLQVMKLGVTSNERTKSRSSLSALLINHFQNFRYQTAQFLGAVEDIDFASFLGQDQMLLGQEYARRNLRVGLGILYCEIQELTDTFIPMCTTITNMKTTMSHIDHLIQYIYTSIHDIIHQYEMTHKGTKSYHSPPLPSSSVTTKRGSGTMSLSTDGAIPEVYTPENSSADEGIASPSPGGEESTLSVRQRSTSQPSLSHKSVSENSKNRISTGKTRLPSPSLERTSESEIIDHPIKKPWYLEYDYKKTEIVFTVDGEVKGGTLEALIERLTLHDDMDTNYINTFLLTYRTFCTSLELVQRLEARYTLKSPKGLTNDEIKDWKQRKQNIIRQCVFNVLKTWVEKFYTNEDMSALTELHNFTNSTIRDTMPLSADLLERAIKSKFETGDQKELTRTVLDLPNPPEPVLSRSKKNIKLLNIATLEMARQLTILDFKLYNSISPNELLEKAWSKSDENGSVTVQVRQSIDYCNQLIAWVTDSILSQPDIKKRSNILKHWIQIAEYCRVLNNFNTCMAILSAFDNSSIGRLKRTWDIIGARAIQTLEKIRKLLGTNRNFNNYRAIIHSVRPPCIPFLGIYLQDLTFIDDGNPKFLRQSTTPLINFAKCSKTAAIIHEIQQYQSIPYNLKAVEGIQEYISIKLRKDRNEEQLYEKSLEVEPKEGDNDKMTRLLQESGFL